MFGAITSDPDYLMYKPLDSPEQTQVNSFVQRVKTDDKEVLLK